MNRLVALLVGCAVAVAQLPTPVHAQQRVMMGYYATFGDLPVEQIPWSRITHLGHAFLQVDAEGEIVKTDAVPNAALTADGRKNQVPVLMTLGGGSTLKGLEKVTSDEVSTEAFVAKLLDVLSEGRYDGVNVDWEFPRNAATRDAHTRLVQQLRLGLDSLAKQSKRAEPYLLVVNVNATPFFGEWIDAEAIVPLVDWLNVMTYDLSGPWSQTAAHHAPLFASSKDTEGESRSVAGAMRYWEQERDVPKEKLVVGVPLFGRAMPVEEPFQTLDPDLADEHRTLSFSAIRKLAGEGWPADWDNESRTPWLSKPASKKPNSPLATVDPDAYEGPILIAYDDRNSVDLKATWTREQGYRGMFFWALHQDRMPDQRHWLLDAANKAWPAE